MCRYRLSINPTSINRLSVPYEIDKFKGVGPEDRYWKVSPRLVDTQTCLRGRSFIQEQELNVNSTNQNVNSASSSENYFR